MDLATFIAEELAPQLIVIKNTAFVKKLECEREACRVMHQGVADGAGATASTVPWRRGHIRHLQQQASTSSATVLPVMTLSRTQRNKLDYVVFPAMAQALLKYCKEKAQELSLSAETSPGTCKWPPLLQLSETKEVWPASNRNNGDGSNRLGLERST